MGIEIQKDSEGNSYVPVPVGKFEPDVELAAAIFLKIDSKFIKFKNQGDVLESEKLDFFLQKSVKNIFIEMDSLESFMEWLSGKREEAIDSMVEEVGEEHRELVEKRENKKEKVYDTFSDMEMDIGVAEILQSQVKEFITEVKEIDISQAVLAKMLKHNSSIADYYLNKANVDVFMANIFDNIVMENKHKPKKEKYRMGIKVLEYDKGKQFDPEMVEKVLVALKLAYGGILHSPWKLVTQCPSHQQVAAGSQGLCNPDLGQGYLSLFELLVKESHPL